MCFSPEVDVVAGVVVGGIGLEALRHVRRGLDVPFASLPLLLGLHQLSEAFIWWDLMGEVPASVGRPALWAYMLFAFVVLPLFVPLAVRAIEPDQRRRRVIARFAVLGGLVGLAYLVAMLDAPVGARITGDALAYHTGISHGGAVAGVYMVATVGALLSSGYRRIRVFGLANVVALPALMVVTTQALASLWCLWAAVSSLVIVAHVRQPEAADAPTPSSPSQARGPAQWMERLRLGAR